MSKYKVSTQQIVLYFIFVFSVVGAWIVTKKTEQRRLEQYNQYVLLQDSLKVICNKYNDTIATQNLALQLTRDNLCDISREAKELKIKLHRITQVERTIQVVEREVKVPIEHIVYKEKNTIREIARFTFKDPFIDLKGTLKNDSAIIDFTVPDTITAILHKGKRRKRFLFFRVGKRLPTLTIKHSNPFIKTVNQKIYITK